MAKRKQPRRQGSKGTPAWAWLLAGLFVGALAYFVYRQILTMNAEPIDVPIPRDTIARDKEGSKRSLEPAASTEEDGVLDTDYSFYDVLPTEESMDAPVVSDQRPVAAPDGQPTDKPATSADSQIPATEAKSASDNSRYLLQAGAFERAADAEDLKARVALSGEAARVEPTEVNSKTLYRVRLGPYANIRAANAAKANLASQGINADSIKITSD